MDIVIENLSALAEYEQRGISIGPTSVTHERDRHRLKLEKLVLKTARRELKEVFNRIRTFKKSEAKIKALSDFRLKLETFTPAMRRCPPIESLDRKVKDSIERIRLGESLSQAEIKEKEGKKPEALGYYKEALSHLNALSPSDANRQKHLSRLAIKIGTLNPHKS